VCVCERERERESVCVCVCVCVGCVGGLCLWVVCVYRVFELISHSNEVAPSHRWSMMLPPSIQVCPVEFPGRGRRQADTPIYDVAELAELLAHSLPLQVRCLMGI
jgi:hypothetical protein